MSYLALALHCEGPTDRRFLEPLLRRALARFVGLHCNTSVDIAEQFVDLSVTNREHHHVAQRVVDAEAAIDLVFVHSDGRNDPEEVRRQQFCPLVKAVGRIGGGDRIGFVAVVPVREMEAWLLADPDAIRGAFGTTRSAVELGLPLNAQDVEGVADPKALVAGAHRLARGLRRGRRAKQDYRAYLILLYWASALISHVWTKCPHSEVFSRTSQMR